MQKLETITHTSINEKIKSFSPALLKELDMYIDFLNFKNSNKYWSEKLNEAVEKSQEKMNPKDAVGLSLEEAKERLNNYFKDK